MSKKDRKSTWQKRQEKYLAKKKGKVPSKKNRKSTWQKREEKYLAKKERKKVPGKKERKIPCKKDRKSTRQKRNERYLAKKERKGTWQKWAVRSKSARLQRAIMVAVWFPTCSIPTMKTSKSGFNL